MDQSRKQSTTSYPVIFKMVLSSDHVTPAIGKTVSINRSKNGGSFASASGSVTELANGLYYWSGNATDRDTLGELVAVATATACDNAEIKLNIVPYDPFDKVDCNVTAMADNVIAAAKIAANALNGKGDWLTSLGTNAPTGWINAAAIAAAALNGKGDWLTSLGTNAPTGWINAAAIAAAALNGKGDWLTSLGTNAPTGWINAAAIAAAALNGKGDWLASGSYSAPPSAASIVTALLTNLLSSTDFDTASSFGKLIKDNLDAAITSRMASGNVTLAASQPNYAPAKAGDAMTLTTGERTAIANETENQIIDDTDSEKVLTAITNKIAAVNPSLSGLTLSAIASQVRTELATELGRLDAAVSTRLATSGYTVPPTAAAVVTALLTQLLSSTDFDTTSSFGKLIKDNLNATVSSRQSTVSVDGKTLEQALIIIAAKLAGKVSDARTGTEKYYGLDGSTLRITETNDASGNRTATTYH